MAGHKSGPYYVKVAYKNNLEVRPGKGSHMIVSAPGVPPMTIPKDKDLSPGVESNIKKWFKALGILVVIVLALIILL